MPQQHGVLVTGATGTVGREVLSLLPAAGARVRMLTRDPAAARPPAGVDVAQGDLRDPRSVRAALRGVRAVFLVWPFATAEGLPAVIEAIAGNARRVVYLSSAAVRDHERLAERLIERSGLEWTFLRPHAFAANALRWAEQIRAEGVVREPYGAAAMPPIHERDIAAVAARTLIGDGYLGAAYELTGPESLTQAEQVRVIGEVTGRPARWEETPPETARRRMLDRGWPPAVVEDVLRAQARLVAEPRAATSAVEEITGTPARSFRSWTAEHARAFTAP
ncbi:nucleotide-diphosphate-sugar epimerase [Planomonospora parontospora subsp. parontospora]|uniref:Nucleotide-diphosphate-sugar epimerase n=2 Tax=Planomonospora parontospora TaxID=58119 RepID=A0AA37BK20_9ACTN|nr:NAD(P)H-binding protein [Planomonospora parontospora]GGK82872.1 nucleotide-diphosphate-sugar epimerase [Planomonospora parontospora]GII12226.1 nucleotide-diphosphate-sugar epimerase [Planomonospora parontospora subsp. parontospora]